MLLIGLMRMSGNDNFKAYKDIIYYRRPYNGHSFRRVSSLLNSVGVINRNGEEIEGIEEAEGEEKVTYNVPSLNSILKTSFEANSVDIDVIEAITEITEENNWEVEPSKISSWYGTVEYSEPTIDKNYIVPTDSGDATEESFNNYTYKDVILNGEYTDLPSKTMSDVYASYTLHNQSGLDRGDITNHIISNTDIYNDIFSKKPGQNNSSNYWYCTVNGLVKVAKNDGGSYNTDVGAGQGSDYIYIVYTTENAKEYNKKTKSYIETLNISNVTKSASNMDAELKEFLELLKNTTGKIPTSVGSEGGFTRDGKVVEYGDIYKGHTPVGDLLLDNGALMLFELLEASENTQGLVNIFKYLAYLYTGTDYGVSIDDLQSIFTLNIVTGVYGGTVEEKIWYTLKQAGFSDEAVAGVMGNIYAESGFKTNNLEGTFEGILGYTDETYTEAVNNGTYTKAQFISDHTSSNCGAGYGLAQWTYYTRKQGLYEYCKSKGVSIDDADAQVEYLLAEIAGSGPAAGYASIQLIDYNGYTVENWKNAKSAEEAAVAFCYIFEKPSTPNLEKRKSAAKEYLGEFKGKTIPSTGNYNGSFLQVAEQCHEYLRINNYYYSSPSHVAANNCTCNGTNCGYSQGSAIPKPTSDGKRAIDCSSYVSWVLYEYGYEELFSGWQWTCTTFINNKSSLEAKGFVFKNATAAVAGDIVVRSSHMEIYAGNGDFYNAGCTAAIRKHHSDSGVGYLSNFTYAITVPNK